MGLFVLFQFLCPSHFTNFSYPLYSFHIMLQIVSRNLIFKSIYHVFMPPFISTDKMERFPIQQYEVGERLDRYLKKSPIGWISAQRNLRKKEILILKADGTITNQRDYRLTVNDTLLICPGLKKTFADKQYLDENRLINREQASRILEDMIIFDNENIAILNKKPGYTVQGGLNAKFNLFSLMSSKYKKQMIYITHRLDRGTSGLVIFAKNKQTAQLVQCAMEERKIFSKFYLAKTEGPNLIDKEGYIRCNIEWTSKNKARLCNQTRESSKDCITFYAPIEGQKILNQKSSKQVYRNLLGIKLLTGRKHQIRCHLSNYLEHPVLNDVKYGGTKVFENESDEEQKLFLHAFGLKIDKLEILEKIKTNSRHLVNESLGSMTIEQNSVLFTAKIPKFWQTNIQKQMPLHEMASRLQKLERKMQVDLPSRRNMSTII